jgi:hypothetical protein
MGVIRIDYNGEIVEKPNDRPDEKGDQNWDEQYRREIERSRREMPDLQIIEIEHTPEKGTDVLPPWVIQGILDSIEANNERGEKDDLPN